MKKEITKKKVVRKIKAEKDWSKFSPRKEILNDYQEPWNQKEVIKRVNLTWYVIAFVLFLLACHEVIMFILK